MSAGVGKRLNALAWLTWLIGVVILVIATRNPLYVLLAGLATGITYLSRDRASVSAHAWRIVLRVGGLVAGLSVAFNLLTVHIGDRVLWTVPPEIPIVGGPATLNALVYGLISAAALLTLMLAAATFSVAVDYASLLRLLPSQLSGVGVAAVIALSFIPQMLQAVQDVREAQQTRGFRVRSARDLPPLVIPVLHLGMERALSLAESMESRGFGARYAPYPRPSRLVAVAGFAATALAVTALVAGFGSAAIAMGVVATVALALTVRQSYQAAPRRRFRPLTWTPADIAVIAAGAATALIVVGSLLTDPGRLGYAPYPTLRWPPFDVALGIACVLLTVPAVVEPRL